MADTERGTRVDDAGMSSELAQAQVALGIYTWLWDPPSPDVRWTGDLSPLLGLPAGAFDRSFAHFLICLHPDDVRASRERLRACLRGELPEYLARERVVWPDGSVHWLEAFGRVTRREGTRVTRMVGVVRDVTERQVARLAVEDSERDLRRLIEGAPLAVGMSRDDAIVWGNAVFLSLFGFGSVQELARARVSDLIAERDLPAFMERSRRRGEGAPVENSYELALRRRDGREFPGLVSVSEAQLADGPAAVAFIQDLSVLIRQRSEIRRERDRATQYLQVAQSILIALDLAGRVTMLNRRGEEVLGFSERELLGRDWFETCVEPTEADAVRAGYQARVRSGTVPDTGPDSVIRTRTGDRRWIAWRFAALRDDDGTTTGVLASGEDVTERRQALAELQALAHGLEQRVRDRTADLEASNAALAAARNAAEAGTRAKDEFLAHMSHEIRTPMNAIVGLTQLALQGDDLGAHPRAYLERIRQAADSLLAIINDLLDYSKMEAGRLELLFSTFDVATTLQRVGSLVADAARAKGLAWRIDHDDDVPDTLVGDPQRLQQVLVNLAGNAVKFTERGAVVLRVRRERPAPAGRVRLRFEVQDSGIGIAPDQMHRLFRPFDQIDATITRRYGGTGLGLAISRQLVDLMGGRIGVESEPGQGSTFFVSLDFEQASPGADAAAPPGAEAAPPPPLPGSPRPLAGRHVLLVEDNELNQLVAHDLLADIAGAAVTVARDGGEALRLAESAPFDLILMDLQMPVMDGFETTLALRRRPALASTPVIAMTAHALVRDRDRALAVGMNDFVTKPFEMRELLDVLSRWLPERAPGTDQAVDFDRGLERCLGRQDLYRQILTRFAESRGTAPGALDDMVLRRDFDALRRLAHQWVSSAATIGADRMSRAAREFLDLPDACDDGTRMVHLESLRSEHAAAFSAVREFLRQHGTTLGR